MLDFVKRIVVVGAGGIGTWLLTPLCRFLMAENFKGQVAIWDGDRFEPKNMLRQDFSEESLNVNKAEAKALELKEIFPELQLFGYNEYVTSKNVELAVKEDDLVITCVDNFPARALIANMAEQLKNICVLSVGNEMFDGNCHVTLRRNGIPLTVPLIDRHPEVAKIKTGDRAELGCGELIDSGETQLLFVNLYAATVTLVCFYLLWAYGNKHGKKRLTTIPGEIYFDILLAKSDVILSEPIKLKERL